PSKSGHAEAVLGSEGARGQGHRRRPGPLVRIDGPRAALRPPGRIHRHPPTGHHEPGPVDDDALDWAKGAVLYVRSCEEPEPAEYERFVDPLFVTIETGSDYPIGIMSFHLGTAIAAPVEVHHGGIRAVYEEPVF